MTIELQALIGVAVTLFALVIIQGALVPIYQGFGWDLASRDEPREPTVLQGRMKRIVANHIEGMVIFAALIVTAHLAGVSSGLTEAGSVIFLISRVLFALIYMIGLPVIRSLVWGGSALGLALIVSDLLSVILTGSSA